MIAYSRQGRGEPLLLVHGVGHYSRGWDPVVPLLADRRDVITVDLPGFGGSPSLPIDQTPAALTDAVVTLLDELGLDRVHTAGNSLGGGIALELSRRGRARSVTGLSPIGFWTAREYEWARRVLNGTHRSTRRLAPAPSPRARRPGDNRLGHAGLHPDPAPVRTGPAPLPRRAARRAARLRACADE